MTDLLMTLHISHKSPLVRYIGSAVRPIFSDRGFRKAGGGVVDAFYEGYRLIEGQPWDYIVKLDGDLSFGPDYFEKCFERFADNHRLGIAGGTVCVRHRRHHRSRVQSRPAVPRARSDQNLSIGLLAGCRRVKFVCQVGIR